MIWILGTRIIKRPIEALRESADHLAGGNLNQEINVNRHDELGSLAISFDKMRNAIRKKLADLSVLNQTGEKLAGIHDQTEALEAAIKVMSEQTQVDRGSIYLLDKQKNLTLHAYYPELNENVSDFPKAFKLSEGIAGQVAASGTISFVPDVSKMPGYVAPANPESPKALLCVPMMDDKEVFGVMNFVGKVGKVRFTEEDEGFALTIARMAVITTKNIQMLEVIEEQNRTLEERILVRTAELRQKTNDVNAMLQNMRQGIFTIIRGGVIHPEYSAFLSEIFETQDIANRPVLQFLFAHSSIGGDVFNQMEATFDAMIGEDNMNFQFNSHLLVHEFTKHFEGNRSKILELDWNPVVDTDGNIEKLMVTVRDVTELKALQAEANRDRIIIRQALSPRLRPVLADAQSLQQIVGNLLANAIRHAGAGGQVIVSTGETERGHVVFRVRDTGASGFKSPDPIVQGSRELAPLPDLSRGTSVDMVLTRTLAEANRGTLNISSKANEGTLFEVSFPGARIPAE